MQTTPEFDALVSIAERRIQAIADRDRYYAEDLRYAYHGACGEITGLSVALDALEAAGLPVASAVYIATVPPAARVTQFTEAVSSGRETWKANG